MKSDQLYFTEKKTILEHLISDGAKNLVPVIEILLNEAMKLEREAALNASPYERNLERKGYANGFKEREYASRLGSLRIKIPQVRNLSFYPNCLEKGERSERALKLAIAEMYINGVSTRKVSKITEELCGFEVSSAQVSVATDFVSDPRILPIFDRVLSLVGIRTPGNFGKRYVLPAGYERSDQIHSYIIGSLMKHLGYKDRDKFDLLDIYELDIAKNANPANLTFTL